MPDRYWIKHLARQRIIRCLWWLYRRIGDVVVLRVTIGWPAPREYVVRVRDLEEEDDE
jgi:hypothetical protein